MNRKLFHGPSGIRSITEHPSARASAQNVLHSGFVAWPRSSLEIAISVMPEASWSHRSPQDHRRQHRPRKAEHL